MMRSSVRMCSALAAVAIAATLSASALAGDLGLVVNGDVELISRFLPHGTPGVDHPNGFADGWHHSDQASWSNPATDPFVSSNHSLKILDDNAGGLANIDHEHRSFAANIPGVGNAGRSLNVSWSWNWNITSVVGDKFSATVRTSTSPAVSLDLAGAITDHVFLTDGTASSGGFQSFATSIPLAAEDQSFDIIFRTWDRVGGSDDRTETGVFFIDNISAAVPEPATLGLLGLGGLGLLKVARRRRR